MRWLVVVIFIFAVSSQLHADLPPDGDIQVLNSATISDPAPGEVAKIKNFVQALMPESESHKTAEGSTTLSSERPNGEAAK